MDITKTNPARASDIQKSSNHTAPEKKNPAASKSAAPDTFTQEGATATPQLTATQTLVGPMPRRPSAEIRTVAAPQQSGEDSDRIKAALVADAIKLGSLDNAVEVAAHIAEMHGKPQHAQEVHAMADQLVDNPETRRQVKLAASLVVLGEWKSPTSLMLGGRLSEQEKRDHIFPINQRAAAVLRQLEGGEPLAVAIEGKGSSEVSGWFHATRDLSAMDAPRKWRQDEKHPDGRLSLEEIDLALRENDRRPGRDPEVTKVLFARYRAQRTA